MVLAWAVDINNAGGGFGAVSSCSRESLSTWGATSHAIKNLALGGRGIGPTRRGGGNVIGGFDDSWSQERSACGGQTP